jgi:uncharacterized coiled-coil protein SlyX
MMTGEPEGLIARIRHLRGGSAAGAEQPPGRSTDSQGAHSERDDRLDALEARLVHLEQLVEGLQDSVHREAERHSKRIDELQTQVQPGAMSAALAEDARTRGL